MSSATADLVPALDSPLDAVDSLLTTGAVLGVTTYAASLLLGNVETATAGVGLGVVCALGTLAVRSARGVAGAL
ncbi:hypothetical protein [Haloplanus halophilus]|uniref:hypothetical protein n=1 Tax=Haloplanus halophilus TaxID=2949993 RepID=UPI00203AA466|nr:hypothetical protein [Haloplanus sp. GDY1]